jgi:hypothetical protein
LCVLYCCFIGAVATNPAGNGEVLTLRICVAYFTPTIGEVGICKYLWHKFQAPLHKCQEPLLGVLRNVLLAGFECIVRSC